MYHAIVFVRVFFSNRTRVRFSTFEIHCLEGKLTFGDPLQDSGVVAARDGHLSCPAHHNNMCSSISVNKWTSVLNHLSNFHHPAPSRQLEARCSHEGGLDVILVPYEGKVIVPYAEKLNVT